MDHDDIKKKLEKLIKNSKKTREELSKSSSEQHDKIGKKIQKALSDALGDDFNVQVGTEEMMTDKLKERLRNKIKEDSHGKKNTPKFAQELMKQIGIQTNIGLELDEDDKNINRVVISAIDSRGLMRMSVEFDDAIEVMEKLTDEFEDALKVLKLLKQVPHERFLKEAHASATSGEFDFKRAQVILKKLIKDYEDNPEKIIDFKSQQEKRNK